MSLYALCVSQMTEEIRSSFLRSPTYTHSKTELIRNKIHSLTFVSSLTVELSYHNQFKTDCPETHRSW
jgi:hypothetical protein